MPEPTFRPNRATLSFNAQSVERTWYVVDATDQVLGRLASRISPILRGKHKPSFTPHVDGGDYVIVVNARHVKLTGRKLEQKLYWRHTGYVGGIKSRTAQRMLELHPDRVVLAAVRGMLPRSPLGRKMLSKLKVYAEGEHPHAAQKPQALEIRP